jgi:hypothetical protein
MSPEYCGLFSKGLMLERGEKTFKLMWMIVVMVACVNEVSNCYDHLRI